MADRTGAERPTPPQLRIRLIGHADELDVALHRLRQAFSVVEAGEAEPLMYDPALTRIHVRAVL